VAIGNTWNKLWHTPTVPYANAPTCVKRAYLAHKCSDHAMWPALRAGSAGNSHAQHKFGASRAPLAHSLTWCCGGFGADLVTPGQGGASRACHQDHGSTCSGHENSPFGNWPLFGGFPQSRSTPKIALPLRVCCPSHFTEFALDRSTLSAASYCGQIHEPFHFEVVQKLAQVRRGCSDQPQESCFLLD
jgi:hypothetical protein